MFRKAASSAAGSSRWLSESKVETAASQAPGRWKLAASARVNSAAGALARA